MMPISYHLRTAWLWLQKEAGYAAYRVVCSLAGFFLWAGKKLNKRGRSEN